MRSHHRQDWTKLFSLKYIEDHQGRNHVFKVGGPIPWSRVLLPSTEKIDRSTQFGAVGYIITLYSSKNYINSWGVRPNFGEVRIPRPPSGCTHEDYSKLLEIVVNSVHTTDKTR